MRDQWLQGERFLKNRSLSFGWQSLAIAPLACAGFGLWATPALAHHPLGGQTPATALEGFLSGLGHPVIGFDHLMFVIAIGLLAVAKAQGWLLPVAFVAATGLGTGIHLLGWALPAPETMIAASVVIVGLLLALGQNLQVLPLAGLGVLAGLCHGYAYGEAIIGAEMTPLLAYVLGVSMVQLVIASGVCGLVQQVYRGERSPRLPLRFAGFTLLGIGVALLSSLGVG